MAGHIRIGTSGWLYKHWSRGVFYPPGLRSIDWLSYYAERFDTVEVNASFYRLPSENAVSRWAQIAPRGFLFAVKCWRWITHIRRLKGTGVEDVHTFLGRIAPLGAHLGPLLVQLPPSMAADLERLEEFLHSVRKESGRRRLRVALEVRHASWLTDETRSLLGRYGAALVIADWGICPVPSTTDGPFVYIRRHGAPHDGGNYSDAEIEADAKQVRRFADDGRDVYVYYNNDANGYAIRNARRLIELVTGRQPKKAAP